MSTPTDRTYSDSHEWHKLDGEIVTLGVTQFAVDELTDITFVETKPVGAEIEPGGVIAEIESVKATADVYSAVGGEVVEVNERLQEDPSVLNSDPYEEGWLVKIKVSDTSPLDSLMDAATYEQKHKE